MKRVIPLIISGLIGISGMSMMAGAAENPCSMQQGQANPCAMKHQAMNPCAMKHKAMNPCSMGKAANPCTMKSPPGQWGTPGNTPVREHAFDNFQQAVALGKKLWSDEEHMGSAGVACLSCHGDYDLLHLEKNQTFPHYVKMVGDVVTLDQMINYCLLNPMKGKQLNKNSKELTAMAAYYRAYRMQYRHEHHK